MATPHKHAEFIKAWADGITVQVRWKGFGGHDWRDLASDAEGLNWYHNWEYRIKPKRPMYEYQVIFESSKGRNIHYLSTEFWDSLEEFREFHTEVNVLGFYHPTKKRTDD